MDDMEEDELAVLRRKSRLKKKIRVDEEEKEDKQEQRGSSSSSSSSDDEESAESESESEDEEVENKLRESFREMPLQKLAKLKRDGLKGQPLHKALGLPSPAYINDWIKGTYNPNSEIRPQKKEEDPRKKKKTAKSMPVELSAKHEVSRLRQVVPTVGKKARDPRFDPTIARATDPNVIDGRYKFLDEYMEKEIEELSTALKMDKQLMQMTAKARKKKKHRVMDEAERREAITKLTKLKQEKQRRETDRSRRKLKHELKAKEFGKVSRGKNPHFVKRSVLREKELEQKFEKLRSQGNLDKFMEKKRKRLAAKDRKLLPDV